MKIFRKHHSKEKNAPPAQPRDSEADLNALASAMALVTSTGNHTESPLVAINEALFVLDANGCIQTLSPSAVALLGGEQSADFIGQGIQRYLQGGDTLSEKNLDLFAERFQTVYDDSANSLTALVEHFPLPILLVDEEGMIRQANAGFRSLFACPKERVTDMKVEELLLPEQRAGHRTQMAAYFQQPVTRNMSARGTFSVRNLKGAPLELRIGLTQLNTPDGTLVLCLIHETHHTLPLAIIQMSAYGNFLRGKTEDEPECSYHMQAGAAESVPVLVSGAVLQDADQRIEGAILLVRENLAVRSQQEIDVLRSQMDALEQQLHLQEQEDQEQTDIIVRQQNMMKSLQEKLASEQKNTRSLRASVEKLAHVQSGDHIRSTDEYQALANELKLALERKTTLRDELEQAKQVITSLQEEKQRSNAHLSRLQRLQVADADASTGKPEQTYQPQKRAPSPHPTGTQKRQKNIALTTAINHDLSHYLALMLPEIEPLMATHRGAQERSYLSKVRKQMQALQDWLALPFWPQLAHQGDLPRQLAILSEQNLSATLPAVRSIQGTLGILVNNYADGFKPDQKQALHRLAEHAAALAAWFTALQQDSAALSTSLQRRELDITVVLKSLHAAWIGEHDHADIRLVLPDALCWKVDPDLFTMALKKMFRHACERLLAHPRAVIELTADTLHGNDAYRLGDNGNGFAISQDETSNPPSAYKQSWLDCLLIQHIVQLHEGAMTIESQPHQGTHFVFFMG